MQRLTLLGSREPRLPVRPTSTLKTALGPISAYTSAQVAHAVVSTNHPAAVLEAYSDLPSQF